MFWGESCEAPLGGVATSPPDLSWVKKIDYGAQTDIRVPERTGQNFHNLIKNEKGE